MLVKKVIHLIAMFSLCLRVECFGRMSCIMHPCAKWSRFVSKSKLRNVPTVNQKDEKNYTKLSRLFVDEILCENSVLNLPKEDSHYVVNVMRMKSGSRIRAFNPKDGEYLAELSCSQRDTSLRIISQIRAPSSGNFVFPGVLFFAPIKKTRLKTLLEKATELGVEHLVPVITQNTQYPMETSSLEAYRKQCIQSAEQCERMTLPVLHNPILLAELLGEKVPKSDGSTATSLLHLPLLICAERQNTSNDETLAELASQAPHTSKSVLPFLTAVQQFLLPSDAHSTSTTPVNNINNRRTPILGILVGPEGGFTTEEMDKLASLERSQLVSLGENVLRAETASIAALSVVRSVTDTIHVSC